MVTSNDIKAARRVLSAYVDKTHNSIQDSGTLIRLIAEEIAATRILLLAQLRKQDLEIQAAIHGVPVPTFPD